MEIRGPRSEVKFKGMTFGEACRCFACAQTQNAQVRSATLTSALLPNTLARQQQAAIITLLLIDDSKE